MQQTMGIEDYRAPPPPSYDSIEAMLQDRKAKEHSTISHLCVRSWRRGSIQFGHETEPARDSNDANRCHCELILMGRGQPSSWQISWAGARRILQLPTVLVATTDILNRSRFSLAWPLDLGLLLFRGLVLTQNPEVSVWYMCFALCRQSMALKRGQSRFHQERCLGGFRTPDVKT